MALWTRSVGQTPPSAAPAPEVIEVMSVEDQPLAFPYVQINENEFNRYYAFSITWAPSNTSGPLGIMLPPFHLLAIKGIERVYPYRQICIYLCRRDKEKNY